ncbi:M24 family metallopeptidase [Desulforhopalus sp. 52FAK]
MLREKLIQRMDDEGFDGIALNAGPSLTYLTGLHFHLMERPVVIVFHRTAPPTIILPELEKAKLDNLQFEARVFAYGEDPEGWGSVFKKALHDLPFEGGRIGIEPRQLRFLEYDLLKKALPEGDWVDGSSLIAELRSIKGSEEITSMTKAVHIAENALEATLPLIGEGVEEREIAAELFLQLIKHGSQSDLPFAPIVAAGPNSANPHSTPSARKLQSGDLLIIDWGARYNGYASDLTRTFGIGELDETAKEIHHLVRMANRAGRQAGCVRSSCAAVDRAARTVIEAGGYGEFFTHRTGHGIGLECHEEPYMRGDNEQQLLAGMTYTVEPGIYLKGNNGVRIEDDVLITDKGAVSLSTMTRELRYL